MQNESIAGPRRGVLLTLLILGVITALVILPSSQFRSTASSGKGLIERGTVEEGIPDFDIRLSGKEHADKLMDFRAAAANAVSRADLRDGFVRGEEELRQRVPTLKIEYSEILRTPELIAPDPLKGKAVMAPPTRDRVGTLRNFLKDNNSLVGLPNDQIDALRVQTDFVNKIGGIGLVILEQYINEIPVFRGELAGHFSNKGELFRVTNNLAMGLDHGSLSKDFGDPANAVRIAAENVGAEVEMTFNAERSTENKVYFGSGHYPASAWKYYFQIEPGVARPAWYVNVWKPITAYEMIIDAETGMILWRMNMGKDQTQSATYRVWRNSTSFVQSMDSPAPLTPGPIDPSSGTQGTLQPSELITLIGNEPPNTFNNNGWITDGDNVISGNNTHAGLDRFNPNGVDLPLIEGSPNRVFDFPANPAPGNPAPGDPSIPVGTHISPCNATAQVPVDIQKAAAVQMFYVVNRLHDVLYLHGFTEQTRNFQVDNFGRGGTGGDPVLAEGQDCASQNNANMASSTTDGTTARMQMFLWTVSSPTRDGTWDADIILHEIGHGVTNRNHINGISGTQGGQMHEGNGDFQAHLLLAEASDPINGIYTTGGYATLGLRAGPPFSTLGNYYYGIRRFPKAVIAFTGGPNDRPHNPLTYADIDPAQHNVTDGAFAPAFTGSATAVHDGGEIWSSMLWEVRSRLVQRLGHQAGTSKMLQLWMDSMRLTTSQTSMLNSRNAMLAAALATGTADDVADVWAGFAVRGLGFSAANPTGNTVIEAFDLPNAVITDPVTMSDAPGDNDGFPEPGEDVLISVPVENTTGDTVTNVTVAVTGGGTGNYGDIPHGDTVVRQIPYTIPAEAPCGSMHEVTLTLSSDLDTSPAETREFRLGVPVGGAPVTFTSNTQVDIPAGQPGTTSGPAGPYPTTLNVSGLSGNKTIELELTGLNHTWVGDVDVLIEGPGGQRLIVFSDAFEANNRVDTVVATLKFRDDADATAPTAGVPPAAATFRPTNHGANDPFVAPAPAGPHQNAAPAGSATLASVFGEDGSTMNGEWRLWIVDDTSADPGFMAGWKLTFESNDYECSVGPGPSGEARSDFDGDGKTDISVFRPSSGIWYLLQSTDGFAGAQWGNSNDVLAPGDYDGDGKTDIAIFRGNSTVGAPDFFVLRSSNFTFSGVSWGYELDVPVVADYDNDGFDDYGIYRPVSGDWYILLANGGNIILSNPGSVPVPGDYDGDGSAEAIIFTDGNWTGSLSGGGSMNVNFGSAGDIPVPGDYDGDGTIDHAVYRPSSGTWFILQSSDAEVRTVQFGNATDIPVPGDYDGDGKEDIAIYRSGFWWIFGSSAGVYVTQFGAPTDIPIVARARR